MLRHSYKRLHLPVTPTTKQPLPLQAGLFKGMYSSHGTELLMLSYDQQLNKAYVTKISVSYTCLKPTEHSLGITNGNHLYCRKRQNTCVKKASTLGTTASFEENCAQTRTFSNTLFNKSGNHVIVHQFLCCQS